MTPVLCIISNLDRSIIQMLAVVIVPNKTFQSQNVNPGWYITIRDVDSSLVEGLPTI